MHYTLYVQRHDMIRLRPSSMTSPDLESNPLLRPHKPARTSLILAITRINAGTSHLALPPLSIGMAIPEQHPALIEEESDVDPLGLELSPDRPAIHDRIFLDTRQLLRNGVHSKAVPDARLDLGTVEQGCHLVADLGGAAVRILGV